MSAIDVSAVICSFGGKEAERIACVLGGARVLPDPGAGTDAAFVALDGALPRPDVLCRQFRARESGVPATLVVFGVEADAALVSSLLEAGADVVWPLGVPDAVIADALRRASSRAPATADDREVVSSIIDSAPDAVFVLSVDGIIRSTNVGVQAMLGYGAHALVGSALAELVEADDAHLLEGLDAPTVVRMRRHDGTSTEVELTARSMLDDPAIRGVLVNARDVSERMSVGAALQESEMRFGAIFDNLLDGLLQVDEESGRLLHVNPAFCRITGYSVEEASRLTLLDLFSNDERASAKRILDEHFRGARAVSEALCIQHKHQVPLYVDLGTTRMELSGARLVLCVLRDVTARRETERTRELFLGVVAHELRTPVAVLQHSVELLRSQPPPSSGDHDIVVGVIDEEVRRLVRLVADAVDLGAIHAGTFVVNPMRVELAPLVTGVVQRLAPQFEGRAALRIEPVEALVDPVRFEQVVTKLLDNAWRHGGAPDIEVSLSAVEGTARLDVVDRGPGLPPELQTSVFGRSLLPNERPTAGIGIGLWLSNRIVRAMGGTIDACAGEGGRGLHVTVSFPRSEDATRTA